MNILNVFRRLIGWGAVWPVFLLLGSVVAEGKLNVVATTPDLASIAQEIGGDKIDLTTLVRPTEDPHFVDAKPSFIVKLNRADVLLEGGAELEIGWLPSLLQGSRNSKITGAGAAHIRGNEGVQMLEIPDALDRSKGDIHAAGNPHFMTDPLNAKIVAQHLADSFAQLDPSSADYYRANLNRWQEQLDTALARWQQVLAPFKGQAVVGYHNSWPYFARRFGLKIDLFLEPKPGIPATPSHLAQIITQMKERNARAIFVDRYLDRRTAETVAARTGAKVVDVSQFPGAIKGTEAGYIALMDYIVNSLAQALGTGK